MKEVKIQPGHCYLIEEEKPTYSNVLMERMMAEDYRGLIITRMNPMGNKAVRPGRIRKSPDREISSRGEYSNQPFRKEKRNESPCGSVKSKLSFP